MTQILQEAVSEFSSTLKIEASMSVSGGDINACFELKTNQGRLFAKVNDPVRYPRMFESEYSGLQLLRAKTRFAVPEPLHVFSFNHHAVLLMEYLDFFPSSSSFWDDFGIKLAEMHLVGGENFGLDSDNYIGSLPQKNTYATSWGDFFKESRILPMLQQARESGLLNKKDEKGLEQICSKLHAFFPKEPPSLLHGDLWSGNAMSGPAGEPIIFDPAVYYGHRYMDLGMTLLFGGFDQRMYHAYNEVFPLSRDWEVGVQVANIYPLLVHLNLFGASYVSQLRTIVKRYSSC